MGTASAWTPERRARQAEAIKRWQPWSKSTGPKSEEGKAVSSRNADKGGNKELTRAQARLFRARLRFIKHLIKYTGIKPFGSADQVGRKRARSIAALSRYENTLEKLRKEASFSFS